MNNYSEKLFKYKGLNNEEKQFISEYESTINFDLDNFQEQAIKHFQKGNSVLVAAPTGSGKTVVGEYAVFSTTKINQRSFYTTPVKALSNQKYVELSRKFGVDRVGLLTGDNNINGDAQIVVMTTEVLRNMIYQTPEKLHDLGVVILDEVHFLADKDRGVVWEEILILLNKNTKIVALSATVSNVEEFAEWLRLTRGDCKFVIEENRSVPLTQLICTSSELIPLINKNEDSKINRKIINLYKRSYTKNHVKNEIPTRVEIVELLRDYQLLPSIFFIFSRNGCDQAVEQLYKSNLKLTNELERDQISNFLKNRFDDIPTSDWSTLKISEWMDCAVRGFSAHHAGLIPQLKESAEILFQKGLLKVVFATETLAVGINMPAKSVVLERMDKWNGNNHEMLTPAEFTQLTGRAGRRGIDDSGAAVIAFHPHSEPRFIANLVASRTFELFSSFEPQYNMLLNLLEHRDLDETKKLLNRSFAQFTRDKQTAKIKERIEQEKTLISQMSKNLSCHKGNFESYYSMVLELTNLEKHGSNKTSKNFSSAKSLASSIHIGSVVKLKNSRRANLAVITQIMKSKKNRDEYWVVLDNSEGRKLNLQDFDLRDGALAQIEVDLQNDFSKREIRKNYSRLIRDISKTDSRKIPKKELENAISDLRKNIRKHSCHQCPELHNHLRVAESINRHQKNLESMDKIYRNSVFNISNKCDETINILKHFEFLQENDRKLLLMPKAKYLKKIHSEMDLIIIETILSGILNNLSPENLAAILSGFIFTPRKDEIEIPHNLPNELTRIAESIFHLAEEIILVERKYKIDNSRTPHFGIALQILKWGKGETLQKVLKNTEIAPGDFIRTTKQLIDLLRQIARLKIDKVSEIAIQSIALIDKGVVSYEPNVEENDINKNTN